MFAYIVTHIEGIIVIQGGKEHLLGGISNIIGRQHRLFSNIEGKPSILTMVFNVEINSFEAVL
jgi:hypothetical protein